MKAICPSHVTDLALRHHITVNAAQTSCSYCSATGSAPIAVDMASFMDTFAVGVRLYYLPHDATSRHAQATVGCRDVAAEISGIAGVQDARIVDDIAEALSATPEWVSRESADENPMERLTYSWEAFKHLVKHEMRFFFGSRRTGRGGPDDLTAMQLLQAVSDIGENTPEVWPVRCPSPIFRARMARSKAEASQWLNPADLGPPPPELAAASRMSPAGISNFYGATDRTTAIAEAGSHTAYRYVVTGEFHPTREIRLIDLTNLPDLPSIFDASERKRYFVLRFMQKFIDDITLPVELDGREHIDYVPTQVFTEYFRHAFPSGVDGLMFPSTQGPGNNVVLFFGPAACGGVDGPTDATRLILDTGTLTVSRVMTVAR